MRTEARPTSRNDAHWYFPDGTPCYELPKADGKGTKKPTLADAKKLSLLTGVTNVLKVAAKPELQNWIIEQVVLAVLTTPRKDNEDLGAFVHRVLHVEKVQDEERDLAAEKGKQIHAACEDYFQGREVAAEMRPWVEAPCKALCTLCGELVCTEKVVVGLGYAGRPDVIFKLGNVFWLADIKTTKTMPEKAAWPDHRLQCAAYAAAFSRMSGCTPDSIRTGNLYISSVEPGKSIWHPHEDWRPVFQAFQHLFKYWQWINNYSPIPDPSLSVSSLS